MNGCEPPCGCWDLNLGPSEEQSVLLSAEPSHQPESMTFKGKWMELETIILHGVKRKKYYPRIASGQISLLSNLVIFLGNLYGNLSEFIIN